jgi:hypothetical protein
MLVASTSVVGLNCSTPAANSSRMRPSRPRASDSRNLPQGEGCSLIHTTWMSFALGQAGNMGFFSKAPASNSSNSTFISAPSRL